MQKSDNKKEENRLYPTNIAIENELNVAIRGKRRTWKNDLS